MIYQTQSRERPSSDPSSQPGYEYFENRIPVRLVLTAREMLLSRTVHTITLLVIYHQAVRGPVQETKFNFWLKRAQDEDYVVASAYWDTVTGRSTLVRD